MKKININKIGKKEIWKPKIFWIQLKTLIKIK